MFGLDLNRGCLHDFLKIDRIRDEKFVRNSFKISSKEVESRVAIISKWASLHPELPREARDEEFVRKMLYLHKFDPNRTRNKIEGFFELFRLYPEVFSNLGTVRYRDQAGVVAVSPDRTENSERVYFCLLNPQNSHKDVDYDKTLVLVATLMLLIMQGDLSRGIRVVFDFDRVNYQHFMKFSPKILWKIARMYKLALSMRITGIELVNVPYFVSSVLGLAKTCLSPKIFDLITVHENFGSLHESIPKRCLPLEYEGDLGSLQKWFRILDEIIENYQEAAAKLATFVPPPEVIEDDEYFFGAFI